MPFLATASINLEAKSADGSKKLPTFGIKAYTGAVMSVGGYYNPVVVELSGLKSAERIPILLDHDTSQIVGQTNSVVVDASGVSLEGIITGEDAPSQKVLAHARNGFEWKASIGADVERQEFLKAGEKMIVNGREVTGPLTIVRAARLSETSFVAIGADNQTTASVAASKSPGTSSKGEPTMFEKWLVAKGFDPAALSDAQRTYLQAQYDAEQAQIEAAAKKTGAGSGDKPLELDLIYERHEAEQRRRDRITALADDAMTAQPERRAEFRQMASSAIAEKTDVKDFELDLMRACRRLGTPNFGSTRRGVAGPKVIEAAVCLKGKIPNVEKIYDAQTLEASEQAFRHGLGLRDLLMLAARENGYDGISTSDVRGLLEASFAKRPPGIRAEGISTLSLPGILSNVANKFLMAGFMAVETGWREIARIRSANDFKAMTTYTLTGDMEFEQLGNAGEIAHGTLGELPYSNRVRTYAKMFAITQEDIRNDDLGALTEIPTMLGRGAALKINTVFWTEFLADANTFWTSGRGNVSTGASSALGFPGLEAASIKFKKQTDPDGKPLALQPRILLVPPELGPTADVLMTSMIVNTGGASTEARVGSANVWANKYRVVESTYLSNSSFTGNSTAAWYLLADPADLPVIQVAFLDGREQPIVETADADFNVLGIQMRGHHAFGVAKMEYRAGVRSAGS